jgi:hypothetical protein
MDTTIAKWMSLGMTAVVIVALLYNQMIPVLQGVFDDVVSYITNFQ